MRGVNLALILALVVLGSGRADEPQDKITLPAPRENLVLDLWDVAYLQGVRSGYVRTVVRELEQDGQKYLHTVKQLTLAVKRFNQVIELRMDTGTIETPTGKVVGVFMRQYAGSKQTLSITGKVVGKQLHLVQDGNKPLKPAPWDDRVLGLYRQLALCRERKVQPGDSFTYQSFEPTINLVITGHVEVKDLEKVEMLGGKIRRDLLRVVVTPEKIEGVELPPLVYWLDEQKNMVRAETKMPGLGTLVLYRTTREEATAPAQAVSLVDIGLNQMIPLARPVVNPYGTRQARYRISFKGEGDAAAAFSRDERQQVVKTEGNTIELSVKAVTVPTRGGNDPADKKPGPEFLESSYFINSADALVRRLTKVAVANETDPWEKALRIESWIFRNMRNETHEALAPADHVARTLNGDCTEHAMLMAAMCRAADIPSRTAVGLIYADTRQGPRFAFHMWTEVWVRGRWVALDATLGRGYVGATHLKVLDHSWHDTYSLTPLLGLTRVMGKISIEVLSVQ